MASGILLAVLISRDRRLGVEISVALPERRLIVSPSFSHILSPALAGEENFLDNQCRCIGTRRRRDQHDGM